MAIPSVTLDNTFEAWMAVTNQIATNIGDLVSLATANKTSVVAAINEIVSGNSNLASLVVSGTTTLNGTVNIGDAVGDTVVWKSGTVTLPNGLSIESGLLYINTSTGRVGFGTGAVNPISKFEFKGATINTGTASRYLTSVNDTTTDAIGVGAGTSFFSNGVELANYRGYKEAVGTSASSAYISTNNGSGMVHRLVVSSLGDVVSGSNNTQKLGTSANRWSEVNTTVANIYGNTVLSTGVIVAAAGINISSNSFVFDTTNKRLGINVASPAVPIHVGVNGVVQTNWTELGRFVDGSANKGLRLGYATSTNRVVLAANSTSASSGFELWSYNSGTLQYEKGFQITESGVGEFRNGIKIGSAFATPTAANTLEAYEEGEFFPTLEINGTQASSFVSRQGSYTRIGNRIFGNGTIKVSSVSGTGTVRIGSLPFTSANVANKDFAVSIHAYNLASGVGSMVAKINENSTKVELGYVSSGSLTTLQHSHLNSNTVISFSFNYEV